MVLLLNGCLLLPSDVQILVHPTGNFLSNAVKFTPAGGKLELKVQCEGVVENKHVGPPLLSEKSCSSMDPVAQTGDTLLGVTGSSILTKTSSQTKNTVDKVATLRISVRDNGIGKSELDACSTRLSVCLRNFLAEDLSWKRKILWFTILTSHFPIAQADCNISSFPVIIVFFIS
jgi:hypothetical protein